MAVPLPGIDATDSKRRSDFWAPPKGEIGSCGKNGRWDHLSEENHPNLVFPKDTTRETSLPHKTHNEHNSFGLA